MLDKEASSGVTHLAQCFLTSLESIPGLPRQPVSRAFPGVAKG